ncbi:MAG: prephenate dehydrogenase/arogenate dehydrogenase family protein [Candidatus Hydrogenedentes bacterium]|nr:prephenate dehydrogenase/arogenate dehydrogenase family protein [Candidatus Hydrogenedentota bacterium]
MTTPFQRVTIVGPGLLGASLGLALKARGLAAHVVGAGRRMSSLETALARGAIDESSLEVAPAVQGADLVVLCTPAARIVPLLDVVRLHCAPGAVITDVASTKAALCARARATWPAPRRFVGSHPMAGSEQFGPEHARADFYEGSVCLVETGDDLDPDARAAVLGLWRAVGARVVDIDPEDHDRILARTSHVPHVVASELARMALRHGAVRDLIGNGFRDATRIAESRPEIWTEICLMNRAAILDALAEYERDLDVFRAALAEEEQGAVERFFEEGRQARLGIMES